MERVQDNNKRAQDSYNHDIERYHKDLSEHQNELRAKCTTCDGKTRKRCGYCNVCPLPLNFTVILTYINRKRATRKTTTMFLSAIIVMEQAKHHAPTATLQDSNILEASLSPNNPTPLAWTIFPHLDQCQISVPTFKIACTIVLLICTNDTFIILTMVCAYLCYCAVCCCCSCF